MYSLYHQQNVELQINNGFVWLQKTLHFSFMPKTMKDIAQNVTTILSISILLLNIIHIFNTNSNYS